MFGFDKRKIKGLAVDTIVMDLVDMGFNISHKKEIQESFGYTDEEMSEIIKELRKK